MMKDLSYISIEAHSIVTVRNKVWWHTSNDLCVLLYFHSFYVTALQVNQRCLQVHGQKQVSWPSCFGTSSDWQLWLPPHVLHANADSTHAALQASEIHMSKCTRDKGTVIRNETSWFVLCSCAHACVVTGLWVWFLSLWFLMTTI